MTGPLNGLRIIELAGLGPAPFCGMMLADHGAEVIRIERPGAGRGLGLEGDPALDVMLRNRRRIEVDLKSPDGAAVVRDLALTADALIEGFRPGVMERLGLGPQVLGVANPRLVYGRMTGWGQTGPLAAAPGHDIDYIALSGALHPIGAAGEPPVPPLNLVGDYGGGAMMLAFGVLAGVLSARTTGKGQVIDCAMTDGSALLSAIVWSLRARGLWSDGRGSNLLDGGAPFYRAYETADGRHMAVGAIEPKFQAALLAALGLEDDPAFRTMTDPAAWPAQAVRLAQVFAGRTQAEWRERLEGTDACCAPVLTPEAAAGHPHNRARGTFVEADGVTQPAPAPRFSGAPATTPRMATTGTDAQALLGELGYDAGRIAELTRRGVVG